MNIEFKWSGKKKQVCRVNGVIIGFVEKWEQHLRYSGLHVFYRWDTRFSKEHNPSVDTETEAKERIEHIFKTWLTGVIQ